jgi:hypothetical protein
MNSRNGFAMSFSEMQPDLKFKKDIVELKENIQNLVDDINRVDLDLSVLKGDVESLQSKYDFLVETILSDTIEHVDMPSFPRSVKQNAPMVNDVEASIQYHSDSAAYVMLHQRLKGLRDYLADLKKQLFSLQKLKDDLVYRINYYEKLYQLKMHHAKNFDDEDALHQINLIQQTLKIFEKNKNLIDELKNKTDWD